VKHPSTVAQPERRGLVRRFFANLGPGVVTDAADDDPSGISTYSVAGAVFGYSFLWTALLSFPLMAAVQLMCARLRMVTGRGFGGAIRLRYSHWVLWPACVLLIVANVLNIGADLGRKDAVVRIMIEGFSVLNGPGSIGPISRPSMVVRPSAVSGPTW
jgi:Mn2+/Fe2+ NRAMP family transporter